MLQYNHECCNVHLRSDWSIFNALQTIQMPRYTNGSGSVTFSDKEKEWASIRVRSAITMMDDDVKPVSCSLKRTAVETSTVNAQNKKTSQLTLMIIHHQQNFV